MNNEEDEGLPFEEAGSTGPDEDGLRRLTEELREKEDLYLRALAELDNTRKRAAREREEAEKRARKALLLEILEVVDTLELALQHASEDASPLKEGIRAIYQQLLDILRRNGASAFESVGEPFDPHLHEAVGTLESGDLPPGTVGLELQKGYRMDDELLRPSRVQVVKES